ncbi:MAG: hypothetical protein CL883_05550 [Dehalococcoidia bacterium]|nr:hypothetical protein [Dehalococcoidia bacterium]|tara:strand:- start:40 stop:390 length:351 start_codon:yes stop_codon:yes gene_type:complete
MIDWNKPITAHGRPAKVIANFEHFGRDLYIIESTNSTGYNITFIRDSNNEHVEIDNNTLYCSAIVVENVPERLHKTIYNDGSVDDEWYKEWSKEYEDSDILGYIYKTGDNVTVELN